MNINFFISFYERTGSTMLCHILNNHSKIKCHFELLATEAERTKNKQEAYKKNKALYNILKIYNNKEYDIVGFKFKFPNQHNYYEQVTKYLYTSLDAKIIFLYRKNIIKNYISKKNQIFLQQKYNIANTNKKPILDKILFDDNEKIFFNRYVINYLSSNRAIYNKIQQKDHLIIEYEDLINDTRNVCQKICNFFTIDFEEKMITDIKTAKISDDSIAKNFINPIQFEQYVKNSIFYKFLEKDIHITQWPYVGYEDILKLNQLLT